MSQKIDDTLKIGVSEWEKRGARAASAPKTEINRHANTIRKMLRSEADAAIEAAKHVGTFLQADEQRLVRESEALGMQPIGLMRVSLAEAGCWLVVAVILYYVACELVLMTLPLVAGFEGNRYLLAIILAVATGIAFEILLRKLQAALPESHVRVWLLLLAAIPVQLLVAAGIAISFLQAEYATVQAALSNVDPAVAIEGFTAEESNQPVELKAVYERIGNLSSLMLVAASVGLDLIAALLLHDALARITTAWPRLRLHHQLERVRRDIQQTAAAIEHCRTAPDVAVAAFRQGVLVEQQKQAGKLHQENRSAHAISIGLLGFIVVGALLFILVINEANADDIVVVGVDQSGSSAAASRTNAEAVADIINELQPGSRFAVIPITGRSFGKPPILDAELDDDAGLFNERLKRGRHLLQQAWEERSKTLEADAHATDVIGALLNASVLFEEAPNSRHILILLSDMRHITGSLDLENRKNIADNVIETAEKTGLLVSLENVRVYVLGAHGRGVSDAYWLSLRRFWQAYFEKAGAELKHYTPNRRWDYE